MAKKSTKKAKTPKSEVDEAPKKNRVLALNVTQAHREFYDGLKSLADKLGCRPRALAWHAISSMLKNPPTEAPIDLGRASSGSASGFWMSHHKNEDGRLEGITITEVTSRSAGSGRAFFRYKVARDGTIDFKDRATALAQARDSALYDADLTGVPTKNIRIKQNAERKELAAQADAENETDADEDEDE